MADLAGQATQPILSTLLEQAAGSVNFGSAGTTGRPRRLQRGRLTRCRRKDRPRRGAWRGAAASGEPGSGRVVSLAFGTGQLVWRPACPPYAVEGSDGGPAPRALRLPIRIYCVCGGGGGGWGNPRRIGVRPGRCVCSFVAPWVACGFRGQAAPPFAVGPSRWHMPVAPTAERKTASRCWRLWRIAFVHSSELRGRNDIAAAASAAAANRPSVPTAEFAGRFPTAP